MSSESEFYVGYLPTPGGLKKTLGRIAIGLCVVAATVAALLVAGQHAFPASSFEFQQYHEFRGALLGQPHPAVSIPGESLAWLLVGPGKHGAEGLPADGEVRLMGERIARGQDHMIEVVPGSVHRLAAAAPAYSIDLGLVQFTGEVVDSKCYFGVMNPGAGKVHRDCAVRCISGGVPPSFLVRDAGGSVMTPLLGNWHPRMLDHVAEPVTLHGRLVRTAGRLTLYAE